MDAYCGTGTIGLVAARGVLGGPGAARVIGVEERPDAVADARNNARHNGIAAAELLLTMRARSCARCRLVAKSLTYC